MRPEGILATFGVDWSHLLAQVISFGIVCVILYRFAYRPVLVMLEARRQQIALGLANAEQITAELARTEAQRQEVMVQANAQANTLIDQARAAAAGCGSSKPRRPSRPRNRSRSVHAKPPPETMTACSPSASARSVGWWWRRPPR